MKFIHTGDLHLDSPFRGLSADFPDQLWERVHQSTFTAWQKIVDLAIREAVDFVLVVGDIFDREHHDVAAEDFFVQQCQRLADAQIPVFLSYGNHDYQDVSSDPLMLPDNVQVFANRVETKHLQLADHRRVALTGFSYGSRWLDDDLAATYPPRENVDFHLGLLHGAIQQSGVNHYAPFTIDELLAKGYDYWALGHIHKHGIINQQPPVVYCGDPQGRHINEDGAHGCYLVEEENGHLVPHFRPVATIDWRKLTVHLDADGTDMTTARQAIADQVAQAVADDQLTIVRITLQSAGELKLDVNRLLAYLQHDSQHQQPVCWWPLDLRIDLPAAPSMIDITDDQYWQTAAQQVFTPEQVNNVLADNKLDRYDFLADQVKADLVDQLKKGALQLLGREGADDEDTAN